MERRAPAIVGRLLLGSYLVAERRLRQGEAARSLVAGVDDEGTTRLVGAAFGAAMATGPLLARSGRGRLPPWVGWVGVGLMTAGLRLRVRSARTLGSHYTRSLRTDENQPVIDTGPYARIRHPGYAGTMLLWLGYGLSLTSLPATLVMVGPLGLAYHRRMDAEEAMLVRELGEPYERYRERTDRLVRGVY